MIQCEACGKKIAKKLGYIEHTKQGDKVFCSKRCLIDYYMPSTSIKPNSTSKEELTYG